MTFSHDWGKLKVFLASRSLTDLICFVFAIKIPDKRPSSHDRIWMGMASRAVDKNP
jgi:hypothetical protein